MCFQELVANRRSTSGDHRRLTGSGGSEMFEDFFRNPLHLWLLLAIVFIVFGAGRLSEVGGALGKGIREFKKATTDKEDKDGQIHEVQSTQSTPELSATISCKSCGALNSVSASFCGDCGSQLNMAVDSQNSCPHCNASNAPEAKFCAFCGSGLALVA
jgi:sec-independent protein translocase protein TatA